MTSSKFINCVSALFLFQVCKYFPGSKTRKKAGWLMIFWVWGRWICTCQHVLWGSKRNMWGWRRGWVQFSACRGLSLATICLFYLQPLHCMECTVSQCTAFVPMHCLSIHCSDQCTYYGTMHCGHLRSPSDWHSEYTQCRLEDKTSV